MAIIRKDENGLYAKVGGWIARPPMEKGYYQVNGKSQLISVQVTKFKEGEKVVGYHFGGSSRIGMEKLVGKGNFEEYWLTSN